MWDKLSMNDRAKYIKLAVQNGITDLKNIRDIYNSYAQGGELNTSPNKFGKGGNTNDYIPATLAGWVTSLFTDNTATIASADIGSSTINTGSDAIPVIGNAIGAILSVGDAIYDGAKFALNPTTSNAADLGTSALGIIPGVGSVKDVKVAAKAAKQMVKNVKTTKKVKAVKRTIERRGTSTNPYRVKINTLRPDMSTAKSYMTSMPFNPFRKIIGTVGNTADTAEDITHAASAFNYENMLKRAKSRKK